jgi:2-dehydro-3-deoxygluconokinase
VSEIPVFKITQDDLSAFKGKNTFVTFGEVMVRDTPADDERPERTRLVRLSLAGSELTLAMGLARLGIPGSYITRVPDNPYGRAVQNTAREQGIDTGHFVWAPKMEPIGRMIYEIGRTPRKDTGVYQRMFSAASRLDSGMVDWKAALKDARLFHTSGISFGLSTHSRYERNYNYEAFKEAVAAKPDSCLVGLDFNYRSTLWTPDQARALMTPVVTDFVDMLITTIEDMARLYRIPCGQYSAEQIDRGDFGRIEDDDIRAFARECMRMFKVKMVAITIRHPDSFEAQRWEAAAMDEKGGFFRSPAVRGMTLKDRLGGGDTWNAGFYYGLLSENFGFNALAKGVLVGDAFTRLKQTLMFDLPIVSRGEVQALMEEDVFGGGKRTAR